jgi:hypothetical protein
MPLLHSPCTQQIPDRAAHLMLFDVVVDLLDYGCDFGDGEPDEGGRVFEDDLCQYVRPFGATFANATLAPTNSNLARRAVALLH